MQTLPKVILGTMNFGGRTPAAEARRIMARAIERAVTHLDTANAYTEGESERLVGEAARRHAGQGVTVATKVGIRDMRGPPEGLSPAVMRSALEASLKRLGLESVALYYLHKPDPETPIASTLEVLADQQLSQRIGGWALSNYGAWRSLEALEAARRVGLGPPATNQLLFNVLIRDLEQEYFEFARVHALPTTVYNPLAGGLLAGHHDRAKPLPGSRFDKSPHYRRRYWSDRLFDVVEDLRAVASEAGLSLVELSYRFLLGARGVDSVIVGPGTLAHLDAALDALDQGALPAEVARAADAVYQAYRGTDARYAR